MLKLEDIKKERRPGGIGTGPGGAHCHHGTRGRPGPDRLLQAPGRSC